MTEQDDKNVSPPVSPVGTEEHVDLGIAGRMTKAFIHSPLSPLFLIACFAIGIMGIFLTPRQEDPQISVPMVDIFFSYPGASAEQVASLATDPLERIMSEITGVKHVYSASQRGQGMVTVEFDVGQQMESSLVKLYDRLNSNLDRIPPGVSQPMVKPKAVDDVPVVALTLWSEDVDDNQLRLLALDVLQRLKEVPETSQGLIVGGRSAQIRIEVLPERLAGFGISFDQVANTIRTSNSEQDVGDTETGGQVFQVYSGSFLRNAEDVAQLVVGTQGEAPIYVRDIAKVTDGPEETRQLVNYFTGPAVAEGAPIANGEAAVTLAVAKKEGSNGVTVANRVLSKVEELKGSLIPDNVHVAVTRNYGETANDKVNELIFKLFVATGAVTVLIWFFLGWRAATVVLVVIPVVILVTVFGAYLLGYTIDRVSLFALIFSIGILVDDAIVVIENIYRRWLMNGEIDTDTAVDAVREVGNPTILATFTVIAALLPMGAVSGMMGPYMAPIPALGSVAILFSLFAAFIFTPWLAMRIRPSLEYLHAAQEREHKGSERLGRLYHKMIEPLTTSKTKGRLFLFSIIAVFFLCCALFYTKGVTVKMMPFDNKSEFNVVINMPEGTALPVTANVTWRLAEALRSIPEVTALQTYTGTASPFNFNGLVRHYYLRKNPWEADIQVELLHKRDRERSSHELAQVVRELLTPLSTELGARIQIVEMPPGPPVLQSVVAEVYGPDATTRRQVAADLTQIFERANNVTDVDNYMQNPYEVLRFEVDTEKAVRRGVSVDVINRNLSMALGGYKLGDIKQRTVLEPTYIVMQVPLEARSQMGRLANLPIPTQGGKTLPLAELGRFVPIYQDQPIFHKDLRAVEYVTGEGQGRLGAPIYGMFEIEDLLNDYVSPDGVKVQSNYFGPPSSDKSSAFEWGGEWTVTFETFRDMGLAFGVALVLIYMLVVWEFGNFTLPAIVMAPIPLTLIGIIPGHWIMGAEFTATSMIGFIALAGIIVRNSILLVDFTKHEIQRGVPVIDALVESCRVRTRPIVITALALVGGSFVILFDPIFQGMAVSLLFGVLVSTLLTLLIIPLGCYSGRKAFCPVGADGANVSCDNTEATEEKEERGESLFMKIWPIVVMAIFAIRAVFIFIWMGLQSLFSMVMGLFRSKKNESGGSEPPPSTPSPSTPSGGGGSADVDISVTEKAAAEKAEAGKAEAEKAEAEKAEAEKAEAEKAEAEKAEAEKAAAEKAEAEKAEAEKAEAEKAAAEKAAAEKAAAEKAAAEKAAAEKAAAEKAAAEKAAAEKAAAEKAAAEKAAAE
ncbi:hypothetical protein BOW53_14225, partial [Solemya pervernicosa gill symbiont]